jgi:hypothetical protein
LFAIREKHLYPQINGSLMEVNHMNKIFTIIVFGLISVHAQLLKVDSVQVDSVWNSDSAWYDGVGTLQNRTSRDCFLSFICTSQGTVSCSLSVSLDSGRTWDQSPNPLRIIDSSYGDPTFPVLLPQQSKPFKPGSRKTFKVRMLTEDKDGVAFRAVCRQYVPSIVGSPKIIYIGGPIDSMCNIPLQVVQSSKTNTPQTQIAKYYWDLLGDGIYDDSTVNSLKNWYIKIPEYPQYGFVRRASIVYAKDINDIISPPETLFVEFRRNIDTSSIIKDTILAGAFSNAVYGSSINFDVPQSLLAGQARLNDSLIDVVYGGNFFSPDTAFASGAGFMTGWNKYNATKFYKATGIQTINLDSLVFSYQIAGLWNEQNVTTKICTVALNDLFLLKTDLNKIVVFQVYELIPGPTGSVRLIVCE